jgi:hypothetical protein
MAKARGPYRVDPLGHKNKTETAPVAKYSDIVSDGGLDPRNKFDIPAAQRQWIGLTDEAIWSEYQTLWPFHPAEGPRLAKDIVKFARAIEARLKELNT